MARLTAWLWSHEWQGAGRDLAGAAEMGEEASGHALDKTLVLSVSETVL